MMRGLYQFILRMHPPQFRRRFCDEMLSIFDEVGSGQSGLGLLIDGVRSFARQWLLRTTSWTMLVAVCGALLQAWWFVFSRRGHQSWIEAHQTLTPYMQELLAITLAITCGLFVMITLLATWNVRFQSRRSEDRRGYLKGVSVVGHTARLGRGGGVVTARFPGIKKNLTRLFPLAEREIQPNQGTVSEKVLS
jgi:hypothetical protein